MSSAQVVITVIVVALIALLAVALWYVMRRRALRERFGPEYDRLVSEQDSRRAAERELITRERRHAQLQLTELSDESRARYTTEWEQLQARFVDAPEESVGAADELVTRLIAERGYPTGDYEDQLSHLSVEHARTLDRYREAHDTSERNRRGEASTEQLRQALVHFRALVAELLGTEPLRSDTGRPADSTGQPVDRDLTDRDLTDRGPVDRDPVDRDLTDRDPVDRDLTDRDPVDRDLTDRDPVDRDATHRDASHRDTDPDPDAVEHHDTTPQR